MTYVSMEDFIPEGGTDHADEIQAVLNLLPPGSTVDFGDRTYIVGSTIDGTGLSDVTLTGRGTLLAKDSTAFQYILNISGTQGVQIEGLTFDANKSHRTGDGTTPLSCLDATSTKRCVLAKCTFTNTLGTATSSSIAVRASGAEPPEGAPDPDLLRCIGLRVSQCSFLNLGNGALDKPSDGIFVRGNFCIISDCFAENVTDHAFVLEGCNYSQIVNCTGENCTSIAGMSNDGALDREGNIISGITGTIKHFGSFGGAVGAYTFDSGKLKNCLISNVRIKAADDASGSGAGLFLFGWLDGVKVHNVVVDAGTTSGKMTAGVFVSGVTQLNYDSESAAFVAGGTLSSGTSTATIYRAIDNGSSGTLWLTKKSGEFPDNAVITGSLGGSAQVNGALVTRSTNVEISDSRIVCDGAGTCIRITSGANAVRVEGNTLEKGLFGIYADFASVLTERDNLFPSTSTQLSGASGYKALESGSATWDPGSIGSGSQATTTVPVYGLGLGDVVDTVTFSNSLQGLMLSGYVSATDTVTIVLSNLTGSPVNLAEGTVSVAGRKQKWL